MYWRPGRLRRHPGGRGHDVDRRGPGGGSRRRSSPRWRWPAPAVGTPLTEDPVPPAGLGRLFGIDAELVDLHPLGGGHIHRTFLGTYVAADGPVRYIHQRLNATVFADLDVLMDNLVRVTAHLAARAVEPRRAVTVRLAADGRPYVLDDAGDAWRTLDFIHGARTYTSLEGPAQAAEAAATVARLAADLADLDPPLPEVIPDFHDVVRRLDALEQARAADTAGRAVGCSDLVDTVLAYRGLAEEVAEARADGRLPQRTVHNDAKTENLLFDEETGAGLCMVDLDTVGPGTVLFDVGDLIRAGATALPEDGDPYQLTVRHDLVDAVLDGYARAGAGFLTPAEVDLLPRAGPLMTLESAARFLTDHLEGDVYFRVDGPGHNLRRARNQLRILELLLGG